MEKDKNKKQSSVNSPVMEEKKYSESELNAACSQLYQKLMKEIQIRDMTNMFKRMDYLFNVIKYKDCFDSEFVQGCTQEIQDALTPVEPEKDKEQESVEK